MIQSVGCGSFDSLGWRHAATLASPLCQFATGTATSDAMIPQIDGPMISQPSVSAAHLALCHCQDLIAEYDGVQAVCDGEGGALRKYTPDGALDECVRLQVSVAVDGGGVGGTAGHAAVNGSSMKHVICLVPQ